MDNYCFLELSFWEGQTGPKQGHDQLDKIVSEGDEGCEINKQGEGIENGEG